MSPHKPPDERETSATAWSPETETRPEVKALLLRRSHLEPTEVMLFRTLYSDIYDTFVDTLRCVVRSRGATGAVEMELVHDALTTFWDDTVADGFPEGIQARLLALASGLARNHVRREGRNPATEARPTSSKETPGSFPRPERAIDLKTLKEVTRVLFERLAPKHRAVIDAVVFRDLTINDAAHELGLPRTTATSRLTAALALLGEWMEELFTASERSF
jgi:DNA-directed RNA polymerase specialized sigma24 family protein